jgi:hypothetical protein
LSGSSRGTSTTCMCRALATQRCSLSGNSGM